MWWVPIAVSLASSLASSYLAPKGGGGGAAPASGGMGGANYGFLMPGESGGMPTGMGGGMAGLGTAATGLLGQMGAQQPYKPQFAPGGGMGRGAQINITDPLMSTLAELTKNQTLTKTQQPPSLAAILTGKV